MKTVRIQDVKEAYEDQIEYKEDKREVRIREQGREITDREIDAMLRIGYSKKRGKDHVKRKRS